MKTILKRGLILGLIIVLVAFVGMGIIDFTVLTIIGILAVVLGIASYLAHNRNGDRDE